MTDIDMLTENSWDAEREERARLRAEQWAALMDVAALVVARVNPISVRVAQYTGREPWIQAQVKNPRIAANQLFGPHHGLEPSVSNGLATFEGVFEGVRVEVYGKASRAEKVAALRAETEALEALADGEVA